jgi:uncharacterized membrane protein
MQNQPTVQPPAPLAKSSTGLDENVAALLSYVLTWVSGLVFFLIEKDSRLVRFHAMQSILLTVFAGIIFVVVWVVWIVLAVISTQLPGIIGTLVSLVITLIFLAFWLGVLIAWIMCLIKAYQSQYFKLPVIGNLAEKFSAK